jgi:hypothetical protein
MVGARGLVMMAGVGLALPGCFFEDGTCTDCGEPFDCEEVAIGTSSGAPDACDVAACTSCVDTCGGDCAILESYPPQYSCGAQGSWSVYETCPDWTPNTGPVPRAEDVTDLGCGTDPGEALVAAADGPGRIAVTHTDAVTGCCPAEVLVDVVAGPDATLTVSYTLVDDLCDCAREIDVSYDIAGVTAGDWTVAAGDSGATAAVTVP